MICQKTFSEDLRCHLRNCSDVYSAFLRYVEEFRKLDSLPVSVNFGNQGTVECFTQNKASQCHQKFNCSMLRCVQLKRKRESAEMDGTTCTSRPKHISLSVHRAVCFFCEVMQRQSIYMNLPLLTQINL